MLSIVWLVRELVNPALLPVFVTGLILIIFYTTALVDPDGTVFFYDDIYGHDEVLRGALAAGYPYP